jgi:predicted nucleotidyltransferase
MKERLSMKNELLERVKDAIRGIEPKAEIILYGSRARGDFSEYSDWDFMVLLDEEVGQARVDNIRHQLHEIEWDTGEVLCAIVRSRKEWESSRYRSMPLSKNILHEGITL